MTAVERTGGEAVVRALVAEGVDTIFGLPGIQNDWLYNALFDAREQIRVIHTRHEQGAAYMALGAAMATGRPAVYNVVPGPGFLNTTAALATAYAVNAPVLCLTGQIPSKAIGRSQGALHEIPDQLGVMRSLTKWAARIDRPAAAASLVAEAFHQLRSGRPRPVGLEVPMDVLEQRELVDDPTVRIPDRWPAAEAPAIAEAARRLADAKAPLIFVGSGAQNVSPAVRRLANLLQAPVAAHRTGRGVVDGRHHLSLTVPESHRFWKDADLVLAIGTNLRMPLQGWGIDHDLFLIRIEVDPTAQGVIRAPDLSLTGRAEDVLPQLIDELERTALTRPSREAEMRSRKLEWQEQCAFMRPAVDYLDVIRDALGEDGILVEDLTQVGFAARVVFPVYHPRTFISTGYQGTLGFGFPTALGVQAARPDRVVISISGDGGFLFGVQELATAVQHRLPVIAVVFNNGEYGNVRQMQRNLYGNRIIATDLVNPDFVALAESFGALGLRAASPAELAISLRTAVAARRPALIEVPVGDLPDVDRFRKMPRVRGHG